MRPLPSVWQAILLSLSREEHANRSWGRFFDFLGEATFEALKSLSLSLYKKKKKLVDHFDLCLPAR